MARDDDDALERGFVLESTNGRYKATALLTLGKLQFHLLSPLRIIVLPGELDELTTRTLTSYGVPHEFLKAHFKGTEYSCRGSRPQDATATYFWEVPQFVRCCGKCTAEDFEYTTTSRGPVVMLSVSLWVTKERDMSVLLVQQSMTKCHEAKVRADPSIEDELREKLPLAGLHLSIQDYVNQLAYERWVEYVAELNLETTFSDLVWSAMRAIEQNLDTARYVAAEGGTLYLADIHAWEGMLQRLDRRTRCIKG
ncbi:hypothetical protein ACQKWADRAFT_327590 [Trichoderma austrokoningii]